MSTRTRQPEPRATAAALAACAALAASAPAQEIINLGVLPGLESPWVAGLSANGSTVVGHLFITGTADTRAFLWTQSGGIQDIGTLSGDSFAAATAVSADGTIITGMSTGHLGGRPFLWTRSGGMTEMPPFPGGFPGRTTAMSHDGSVITGWSGYPFIAHAFRWTAAGGYQDLGSISDSSHGTAISADGSTIVGDTHNDTGYWRAIRWTAQTGMVELPLLPGTGTSAAADVSADGSVVVGYCYGQSARPFRWTALNGTQPLPAPPGAPDGYVTAVTADGQIVVGDGHISVSNQFAAMWLPTGAVNLNTYLPTLGINLQGWDLRSARDISADGRTIAGHGRYNGAYAAWLVRLGPPCYANCDDSTQPPILNISDFICFMNRYSAGDPYANCDNSTTPPVLNISDFVCFQGRFAAGCS